MEAALKSRKFKPPTPAGDPTPEEIRALCEQIQSEWSEEERLRRTPHKGKGPDLTIPTIHSEMEFLPHE